MVENKPDLKILVPHSTTSDTISVITLIFDKLIPHLEKKFTVKIIRLVYQPEKFLSDSQFVKQQSNVDIHDFDDAVDAVKSINPDLIYANPDLDFINPSFVAAGKICNIPIFNLIFHEPTEKINYFKHFRTHVQHVLDSDIPTQINSKKSSSFGRGKFIFYKFLFCVKTFKKSYTFSKFLKSIFLILKAQYFQLKHLDPKFAIDLHCLLNQNQYDDLQSHGFPTKTLCLVGNPMYDDLFSKKNTLENKKNTKTIKILFAPDPFYEHGDWTKNQRDLIFNQITKKLFEHMNDFSPKIKIHPAASKLEDYEQLLQKNDFSIPIFKNGTIENFLDDADLVITYSSLSTGIQYAALMGIPIIICNFFNRNDNIWSLIDSKLAMECFNIDELVPLIIQSQNDSSTLQYNLKKYVENHLYKDDGKAGERMANAIFNLLEKY